jgi:hypothetical protein
MDQRTKMENTVSELILELAGLLNSDVAPKIVTDTEVKVIGLDGREWKGFWVYVSNTPEKATVIIEER